MNGISPNSSSEEFSFQNLGQKDSSSFKRDKLVGPNSFYSSARDNSNSNAQNVPQIPIHEPIKSKSYRPEPIIKTRYSDTLIQPENHRSRNTAPGSHGAGYTISTSQGTFIPTLQLCFIVVQIFFMVKLFVFSPK